MRHSAADTLPAALDGQHYSLYALSTTHPGSSYCIPRSHWLHLATPIQLPRCDGMHASAGDSDLLATCVEGMLDHLIQTLAQG
jgi:hypothetical protein